MFDPAVFSTDFDALTEPAPEAPETPPDAPDAPSGEDGPPWVRHGVVHLGHEPRH